MGGSQSVYLLEMAREFPLPSIIRRDHFLSYTMGRKVSTAKDVLRT
jgi:hypothetical protein